MKGLFLGAGASYEVGMPLVCEFSQTLRKNVLKRLDSNLFNFKSDVKLKKLFIELLSDDNLNYEQVVGQLEKKCINARNDGQRIHGVIIQLIECIQLLLLEEQGNTLKLLAEKIKDYYGIQSALKKEGVINVFSLNHDIVFEEICDYFKIPYKDGFYKSTHKYSHIANFKCISSEQLIQGNLDVFNKNEYGINLFKLHGAIDIFAVEDKNLFLKSYGDSLYVGSNYSEIRKIEDRNLEILQKDGIRATNELYVYDADDELQFLRRSLLSGAYKFQGKFGQIAPVALFEFFKVQLQATDELSIVGYGFGDSHINEVLVDWLENKSKTIVIYDPWRDEIPEFLDGNISQISLVKGGLTDYFLAYDSSGESYASRSKREMINFVRENLRKRRLSNDD